MAEISEPRANVAEDIPLHLERSEMYPNNSNYNYLHKPFVYESELGICSDNLELNFVEFEEVDRYLPITNLH